MTSTLFYRPYHASQPDWKPSDSQLHADTAESTSTGAPAAQWANHTRGVQPKPGGWTTGADGITGGAQHTANTGKGVARGGANHTRGEPKSSGGATGTDGITGGAQHTADTGKVAARGGGGQIIPVVSNPNLVAGQQGQMVSLVGPNTQQIQVRWRLGGGGGQIIPVVANPNLVAGQQGQMVSLVGPNTQQIQVRRERE